MTEKEMDDLMKQLFDKKVKGHCKWEGDYKNKCENYEPKPKTGICAKKSCPCYEPKVKKTWKENVKKLRKSR